MGTIIDRWKYRFRLWKRSCRFFVQRRFRGWSDDETWNLDRRVAEFALPRLKRFKELNNGFPCDLTFEDWNVIIHKMIYAFEEIVNEDDYVFNDEHEHRERYRKIQEGTELFGKYFCALWW